MNDLIFKLKTPVRVAGLTVGETSPAVLLAVDTGLKTPVRVAGLTVGHDPVKVIITLLSIEDLKKFE